jgi:holo-[acyl-carrier protein] synthase
VIVGVGIDIAPVARFEKARDPGDSAHDAVFTSAEAAYCESKRYPARHFAARFAAKEASLKALGGAGAGLPPFLDVEVCVEDSGIPRIEFHGRVREMVASRQIDAIHVSLTHTEELAAAVVLLESSVFTEVQE